MIIYEIILRFQYNIKNIGTFNFPGKSFEIGSYDPSKKKHKYIMKDLVAPTGFLMRGKYFTNIILQDNDKIEHAKMEFGYRIARE